MLICEVKLLKMHINIINKPEHDKVTFGLVDVLVIVVGVLGYIVLRI